MSVYDRWHACLNISASRILATPYELSFRTPGGTACCSAALWIHEKTIGVPAGPLTGEQVYYWFASLHSLASVSPPAFVAPYPLLSLLCCIDRLQIGQRYEVVPGLFGIVSDDHAGCVMLSYWSMRPWLVKQGVVLSN